MNINKYKLRFNIKWLNLEWVMNLISMYEYE